MATEYPGYLIAFSDYLLSGEDLNLQSYMQSSQQRAILRLYRNGFLRSSIAALRANFPALITLMGEAEFNFLAHAYVEQFPAQEGTLVGYGRNFPAFISRALTEAAVLTDIAYLDQAWLDSLHEFDDEPISADAVKRVLGDQHGCASSTIALIRSVRLLSIQNDVLPQWMHFKQTGEMAIQRVKPRTCYVLLWKQKELVRVQPLEHAEWLFLTDLFTSQNLFKSAEKIITVDAGFDLSGFFSVLIEHGLLRLAGD